MSSVIVKARRMYKLGIAFTAFMVLGAAYEVWMVFHTHQRVWWFMAAACAGSAVLTADSTLKLRRAIVSFESADMR